MTPGRFDGALSAFRSGSVTLGPAGVYVNGRAVLPAGLQIGLMALGAFFCLGGLIGAILFEYVIRFRHAVLVPWNQVEQVVRDGDRVCLVLRLSAPKERIESLAFRVDGGRLQEFLGAVQAMSAGTLKGLAGRIPAATPPAVLGFALALAIRVVAIALYAVVTGAH